MRKLESFAGVANFTSDSKMDDYAHVKVEHAKLTDPFTDKIMKPRNIIQWQIFNSKVLFNKNQFGPVSEASSRQIA